ncbi:OLC1v1016719C1 [Oldenlandia corymbosa var. corymbosa]|uniref:myrcene synthase n=1 Tax=Oldenlandia corymbosa var. corymbosa TaxID=529605 RepID=A0AAV1E7U0_OLDCO|nr:OLC1v1016719C1 [Oldenlandia corymbosa var. corymbosa]
MDDVLLAGDSKRQRRSGNFPPSMWEEHLQALLANSDDLMNKENSSEQEEEHYERLKEEVRKMLITNETDHGDKSNPYRQKLDLIDTIQRLGVAYHFESEIEAILLSLRMELEEKDGGHEELHKAALLFRLLRQLGHCVSCDMFNKFKDQDGDFKKSLQKDVQGLLSFYEAANYRFHDEDILEEAMNFTASQLLSMLPNLDNFWSTKVKQALKLPIQKTPSRVGARRFISLYQQDILHNTILLKFAKLNFNMLQRLYQNELSIIAKWWKNLDRPKKFPFARDRMIENYFWILAVYFEPKYSLARISLSQVINVVSIVDDIYDTYGFLDELVLFTDSIERWHISASDQLPSYMNNCYLEMLNVYSKIEERLSNQGKSNQISYGISSMKELVRAYFEEAKWMYSKDVPNFEEYMKVALMSSTYKMLPINSLVCMGEFVTEATLDWMDKTPLLIRAASIICRLMDDIADSEWAKERGQDASAVECYMKQYGTSKQETLIELRKQLANAWKDINKECFNPTSVTPMFVLERILNFVRIMHLLYESGNDAYTNPTKEGKDLIISILFDRVPL